MSKLFGYIVILVSTALAGAAVIVALTLGKDSGSQIAIAAAIGALLGIPLSWFVTGKIAKLN